jgi:hypothetical protein
MDIASALGGDMKRSPVPDVRCGRNELRPCVAALCSVLLWLVTAVAHAELNVLIIEGLGGEAKYSSEFAVTTKAVRAASATMTSAERIQVLSGEGATLANLGAVFKQLSTSLNQDDRFELYLIGHGSYDGYEYKFNLPGPDLAGAQLAKWLDAIQAKNQLIVATGSSSGALQEVLKKDSRIVLTATRSGNERNATHFGRLLPEAFKDNAADTDKNGRVTAQEAFDFTTRKVKDYFEAESRLATEHAVLTGAQANAFTIEQSAAQSTLATGSATAANAPLLAERERLNSQLEELRLRKESMSEDDYLKQLEPILLRIAELDAAMGKETK